MKFRYGSVSVVVLMTLSAFALAGDHGVVDDEIWHHVTKVLSEHEGHGKVLLSHPEPAHLVDAYTKVYHHEPYHHHHHGHHDDYHYRPVLYRQPNPYHHHHHHHAPPPPPLFRAVPVIRFGPPPHHHHHY